MRVHYLQHVPFEGLGHIETWLRHADHEITATRFYAQDPLPSPDDLDLLIIMGGPMSVNEEAEYPWLVAEKAFVRTAIASGKPVLGICLGAQLIASALGAAVYPNHTKEIGWFPIEAVAAAKEEAFQFPPSITVFHWHGETFDLPEGAVHLAKSAVCAHQAFQIGSAVGLQFHLETTPESAKIIIEHCREELTPAAYIQTEADMLAAPSERYEAVHQLLNKLLAWLCAPRENI